MAKEKPENQEGQQAGGWLLKPHPTTSCSSHAPKSGDFGGFSPFWRAFPLQKGIPSLLTPPPGPGTSP